MPPFSRRIRSARSRSSHRSGAAESASSSVCLARSPATSKSPPELAEARALGAQPFGQLGGKERIDVGLFAHD